MKAEEQIREEVNKHKEWLKENQFTKNENDKWLHKCIIEALEWVLK